MAQTFKMRIIFYLCSLIILTTFPSCDRKNSSKEKSINVEPNPITFSSSFGKSETELWLIKNVIQNANKSVQTITNPILPNNGQKYTEKYNLTFVGGDLYFTRTSYDAENKSNLSEESHIVPVKDITEVTTKRYIDRDGNKPLQLVQVRTLDNTMIFQYKDYTNGGKFDMSSSTTLLNIHLDCTKNISAEIVLALLHMKSFYQ